MTQELELSRLTWDSAHRAVEAAARKALELGVKISVSVLDAGGNPLSFVRIKGAALHSISISADKAYTAVSYGLSTGTWTEELKAHSDAVRQGLPLRPRFVMFGGGLPIWIDGELIGGIGVSGASEEQDEECAQSGLDALTALRKQDF